MLKVEVKIIPEIKSLLRKQMKDESLFEVPDTKKEAHLQAELHKMHYKLEEFFCESH